MRCFIPDDDDWIAFRSVEEARLWLSDPENIERIFGDKDDDYYVELIWDKDYDEYEDWIHIDGWELRQIRLLLGMPLKGVGWPYMVNDSRNHKILEFDNYEDFAKKDQELYPSRWTKAKGLRPRKAKKR